MATSSDMAIVPYSSTLMLPSFLLRTEVVLLKRSRVLRIPKRHAGFVEPILLIILTHTTDRNACRVGIKDFEFLRRSRSILLGRRSAVREGRMCILTIY